MSHTSSGARPPLLRAPLRIIALLYGVVLLLAGVLGFVSGATVNYGALRFAGQHSEAMLLGVFQVSILHNIIHLLYGVAGLIAARTVFGARNYLGWGGLLYLGLWIYEVVIDEHSAVNIVPVNSADNWLHLVLGVSMTALCFLGLDTEEGIRPTQR